MIAELKSAISAKSPYEYGEESLPVKKFRNIAFWKLRYKKSKLLIVFWREYKTTFFRVGPWTKT